MTRSATRFVAATLYDHHPAPDAGIFTANTLLEATKLFDVDAIKWMLTTGASHLTAADIEKSVNWCASSSLPAAESAQTHAVLQAVKRQAELLTHRGQASRGPRSTPAPTLTTR